MTTPIDPTTPPTTQANTSNTASAPIKEIQLPAENKAYDTPSIWPLAAGWWVVIIIVVIALGFASYKGFRYRQMKRQQHAILNALDTINQTLQRDKSSIAISQINQLLRRLALMHFPRQQVASLTGKQWLAFLDKTGKTTVFSQGAGRILAEGPYVAQLPTTVDHQGLAKAVKQWLTHINRDYHRHQSDKKHKGWKRWK